VTKSEEHGQRAASADMKLTRAAMLATETAKSRPIRTSGVRADEELQDVVVAMNCRRPRTRRSHGLDVRDEHDC
jgi:hypothetical protein